MFKNTRKFLIISFSFLIVVCILSFMAIAIRIGRKSNDAVSDVGMLYMSEMNRQLQEKYTTVIELRLSQVEGIVKRTPPESVHYGEEMMEELAISASVRDFTYLGLYKKNGDCETIYGESLRIIDEKEFLEGLDSEEIKISSAEDASGERVLLLIQAAEYEMKDGSTSVALVAGIPMEYLNEALFLEEEGALIYSHVIRADGSYVIRNGDSFRGSYFERMQDLLMEFDGKKPEDYVRELKDAMAAKTDYTTLIMESGIHGHIYCSSLSESDWYLITVMPYGPLDDAINKLGNQRTSTLLIYCLIILAVILAIFALYYQMTQKQIRELNEAKLEADHANKAKSEFLSNMSHDIRTPMNGIVGMTAIAVNNIDDKERVRDCLRKITLSSKHLLGLINDVLDMSKIESGKLTLNMDIVSLRDAMESIVNIVQPQVKAKKQHFDIFIKKIQTENIYCDSVRLNQVLINLLSNAIKYTPEKGRINIYLSQEESPLGSQYVRCHFRVKDNGIGMSEEFQKTIFDTFTREKVTQVDKTEGAGLGMAITKCIVDAMKGTIELHSKSGEGSEFHITLDLERAKQRIEDIVLPSWNTLVVDNNEDLCHSAAAALKEIGINAEYALSGKEAVEMVKKRHDAQDDYQLVLIDWKMPEMDGLETAREIRKRLGAEVPILIISAYDWSDIKDEAMEAGANGFISKPLFKSNLYLGLSKFIEDEGTVSALKEEEEKDFTGRKILLAEDNDLNWEIANEILSTAGFKLEHAENGKICVEKFEASEEGTYDVILMDIRMPVMNGYDAAKTIRGLDRADAHLPIIAMTADAFSEDIQHSLDCGMNAHISKPIDVKKLMDELAKYLN